MARRLTLVALAATAVSIGAASAQTALASAPVIPYLSGGAGVYLDEDGRPLTSEGAPRTPGIHFRPPVPPGPVPAPAPPAQPEPQPEPQPQPPPTPQPVPPAPPVPPVPPVPAPPPEGYARPDLLAAVGVSTVSSVFCRTDAAWPTDPSLTSATGYWRSWDTVITMRTWRCEGIARERIGTEAFARGLFVLAHEAAHAVGIQDECEADKRALATMGEITARLGWGWSVGDEAGRFLNDLLRANPLPDPYCLGRLP